MFALVGQFLMLFGFKVSVRRASSYPLAPKAEKVTKKMLPKTATERFDQFWVVHGIPVFHQISRKNEFWKHFEATHWQHGFLLKKVVAQRHLQTPKNVLNHCRVIQKHSFHHFPKSCSREGPGAPFWMLLGSKNQTKLEKMLPIAQSKNHHVSEAH